MKILVTQTLPNGQVTQQVLSREGNEVLKIQAQPGAKISFNVEGVAPKSKNGGTKKIDNNLVLEADGEPLVEVTDIYTTAGTSMGEVSWNYAAADAGVISATPEVQAASSATGGAESGALLPAFAPGWLVAGGVAALAAAAGGGSSAATTASMPTAAVTAAVTAITSFSADTGISNDLITKETVQSVSGTFTGVLAGTEHIRVSADGGVTWVIATTVGNTWTADNVNLVIGSGHIITQTINSMGDTLAGITRSYTLDNVVSAPVFTLSNGNILSGQSVVNGTAEAGATVTVTVDPDSDNETDNSFNYTVVANASGVWRLDLSTALTSRGSASFVEGAALVSASQTDVAGNTSDVTSASYTTNTTTSYTVVGPTDAAGQQLQDANLNVLGVDEAAGVIRFAIVRSGDTSVSGTVSYTTQNGTATAEEDYTHTTDTVAFEAGETLKIITVDIAEDGTAEANETLSLLLTEATNGFITIASSTATINDNEQALWRISSAPSVDEGAGTITYTITRTGKTDEAADIHFATAGGTATAGADYTAIADQTVSFAVGETSKTVTVNMADDSRAEPNETLTGAISNASVGFIVTASSTTTINDNEQSNWSVASSGNVDETAGYLTFIVSRTGASAASTIEFATGGGTATAGLDISRAVFRNAGDYTTLSQTLSFAQGEMSKTVQVALNDDSVAEPNETLTASITNAQLGSINTGTATATIIDNEQSNWSVAASSAVDEGAGFITYTVSRTGASDDATIDFSTSGGTATAGSDYTAVTNLNLTFAEGQMSQTVQVAVTNDEALEVNETVVGVLSNVNGGGTIETTSATATINDNDQSLWRVVHAGNVSEAAGRISVVVSRTGATSAATLDLVTYGSATPGLTAGSDYQPFVQTLSFANGEMSKTVLVNLVNDAVGEIEETVAIALTNISQGTLADSPRGFTIIDDDLMSWAVSTAATVSEGAGFITYTVSRTSTSGPASIRLITGGGTAREDVDYTATNTLLSFNDGELSKTVLVAITNDSTAEQDETVVATLTSASVGTLTTATATATLLDDEQSLWSVNGAAHVREGPGFASFTVSRTGALNAASIDVYTGSPDKGIQSIATLDSDFTSMFQTLDFAEGESSKTVQVAILNDDLSELVEYLTLNIANASEGGSIKTATASVGMLDDDGVVYNLAVDAQTPETAGFAVFRVSREWGRIDVASTVDFHTSGTEWAAGGTGFTVLRETVSFGVGEVDKYVSVPIHNITGTLTANNTSITGYLSNASTGQFAAADATTTILDATQTQWAIGGGGTVVEDAGTVTFTVSRTGNTSAAATIDVSTLGGTAVGGADESTGRYTALNQSLSFAAGEASKTVQLRIHDDGVVQGATPQTVTVGLSNASVGNVGSATATATLTDNDVMLWSVATTARGQEGDGGVMSFVVSRTGPLTAANIDFALLGGDGRTALPGVDFVMPSSGSMLEFAEGESQKLVRVTVLDDELAESYEGIVAMIGNQTLGQLSKTTNLTSILANDLTRTTFAVTDGTGGSLRDSAGAASFVVTRDGDVSGTDSIRYSVAGTGGATADVDFEDTSGTVLFAAGERTKVISVPLIANNIADDGKGLTFTLQDASAGTILSTAVSVTVTLTDTNSPYVATPEGAAVTVVSDNVNESAGFLAFTLTRYDSSAASTSYWRANSGTAATDGSDYTVVTLQSLSWAAGETSKIVRVQLVNDAAAESSKTITLESAWDADFTLGVSTTSATATLLDDDTPGSGTPTYAMTVTGTTEGSGFAPVTITRSGDLTQASTSYLRTKDLGAVAGTDYTAISGQTLNWAVGESQKVVLVSLIDDTLAEPYEFFQVEHATDNGFALGSEKKGVAIYDDDRQVMTPGKSDTLSVKTASGTYLGGALLDTGDMDDSVTVDDLAAAPNNIVLGSGNDRLTSQSTSNNMLMTVDGGEGVDTFALSYSASAYAYTAFSSFAAGGTNDGKIRGFEILDLSTATTSQTVMLSLANVLEMTRGNEIANTLRVMGTGGDSLNLQADGKLWRTLAIGSSVTDVDGTTYTVTNSGSGNSAAMEVVIGGNHYDVYRYVSDSQNVTLLVDTRMVTSGMGTADEVSDGLLNAVEAADGLTTTISLANQEAEVGQILTVVLNGTNGGDSQRLTRTLTATDVINGFATLTATATELANSGTGKKTLTASINGGQGYPAGEFAYNIAVLSATAPTVTAGAEVWKDQLVGTGGGKVHGTWDAAEAGVGNVFGSYNLTVSVGGATYGVGSGVTVDGNKWTLSATGLANLSAGTYNVVAGVSDLSGNSVLDADGVTTSELTVKAGTRFSDMSAAAGLPTATNGNNTAVTIADFNGDGVKDIYVPLAGVTPASATTTDTLYTGAISDGVLSYTASTGLPTNTLIYNTSNGGSSPQTAQNSAAVDYDNDGDLDLAVANGINNYTLLRNNGSGAFTDVTFAAGINASNYTPVPNQDEAWADYNGDGFVDVYLASQNGKSSLFTNQRDGSFALTSVTGMTTTTGSRTDAIWADVTGDGRLDLLVGNSVDTSGHELYINNATGTFGTANSAFKTLTTGFGSLTLRMVDYDNDGDLDVYLQGTTADHTYKLLQNNGSGTFTDVTATAFGSSTTAMTKLLSKSAVWLDYDMDGYLDLIQASTDSPILHMWHNDGNGTFSKASNALAGLTHATAKAEGGWAVADVDNNGTQDLYMIGNNVDLLYKNNATPTAFLSLKVLGSVGSTPLYGAKVQVFEHGSSTPVFTQYVLSGESYATHTDDLRFYGLDASKTYDVKVTYATDQDASATVNLQAVTTTFNNSGAGYSASTTLTPVTLIVNNNATAASAGVTTTTGSGGDEDFTAAATGKEVIMGLAGTDTLSFGDGAGAGAVATWTSINSKDANGATGETNFTTNFIGPGTSWSGIDALQCDTGADVVADGVGVASIHLGGGNDTLLLGAGAAGATGLTYNGGEGTNTLGFGSAGFAMNLVATGDLDGTVSGGVTGSVFNFTNFRGSALVDTLDLSLYTSALTILGSAGGDTVIGGSGNDIIESGAGNDTSTITAGGVDTLKFLALASGNADALWGNGADTVTGFVTNKDTVLDAGEDKIDLSAIFSGKNIPVNSANLSSFFNTSAAANSILQIDRDGTGGAYGMTDLLTINGVSLTNADLANMLTAGQLIL